MSALYSMTGYGSARGAVGGQTFLVEIKSVNNRFLDCSVRLPRSFLFAEDTVKNVISSGVSRGKVDVFVTAQSSSEADTSVSVNLALAEEYRNALRDIADRLGVEFRADAAVIARFPDVLTVEKKELDADEIRGSLSDLTHKALEEFNAMRAREGERLREDMLVKLKNISELVTVVEERSPETVREYRERLEARLRELLDDRGVD